MGNGLLSFSEERLWILEREETGSSAFVECPTHLAACVRLLGRLDVRALGEAFNEFVRRHEVLRSRIIESEGRPVREVARFAGLELPVVSLNVPPDGDREGAIKEALAADIRGPFDLAAGPLLRARLLRLGEEEHVLAVVVHHIVFDGWSLQIMWRELAALYGAYAGGQAAPLPELKKTYADYVEWQRGRLEGERLGKLLGYWSERLRDAPELIVPRDRPAPPAVSNRSARERFEIPAEQAEALRKFCRDYRVTSGLVLVTVFKVLLHRLTGAEDLTLGMTMADRNRPEFEPLVGLFLNLLVLRTNLSQDPTFLELFERARRTFISAYEQRDLPYGFLLSTREAEGQVMTAPLRVVFNFVVARSAAPTFPGLAAERVEIEGEPPSFADLSLHVFDRGGAMSGFMLYKTDLFSGERVKEITAQFVALLSDILDVPGRRLSEYTLARA